MKEECVLSSGHVLLASMCVRESCQCKQMTHPEGAPPHTLKVNKSTENTLSHHPNERMARIEVERKQQCFSSSFFQRGIEIA